MSDESYREWKSEQQLDVIKHLRESLKAVIAAYEQAGYIMGKQPDAITQVLIDAKQTLKETE